MVTRRNTSMRRLYVFCKVGIYAAGVRLGRSVAVQNAYLFRHLVYFNWH